MALDEPKENEQTVTADGLDILISEEAKPYAAGNILDWVQAFGGEGFILQPESGSTC